MGDIIQESLSELMIALTCRWHTSNGNLAIGVPRKKLLHAGEIDEDALEAVLKKLRDAISGLGMELVEYNFQGEDWYAIRSKYVCPTDVKEDEEAVLAYVISCIESDKHQKALVEDVQKKFVSGKYYSRHQIERLLKDLEKAGYLIKNGKSLQYGPRTMLEFTSEARQHIAIEAKQHII